MNTLTPVPLTAALFKPYGDVIETTNRESISINSGNCQRYTDLAALSIDDSGLAGISLFDAKPYASPLRLYSVERHPLGSQAFLPMTNEPFLVIVAADNQGVAQRPTVFVTNGKQGVNYAINTWHGVLTPIVSQSLFAVVDYIGGNENLEEFTFDAPYTIEF